MQCASHFNKLGFSIFLALCASAAWSEMPLLAGEPVLTVSGQVMIKNTDETFAIDFEMMAALPTTEFTTTTIWTDGPQKFVGVELVTLLAEIGAEGQTLKAVAVNDYAIDIPISDAVEGGPIVAYLLNDREMSVRDKGPLWIVYPYDQNPKFQTEVVYARSIWQLNQIIVQP